MIGAILFISLTIFLILNVPVGISIGLSTLAAVLFTPRMTDTFIVQHLIAGSDSFPLMAIPLFILAGDLMGAGGVSGELLMSNALGRHRWSSYCNSCYVCSLQRYRVLACSGCCHRFHYGACYGGRVRQKLCLAVAAAAGSIDYNSSRYSNGYIRCRHRTSIRTVYGDLCRPHWACINSIMLYLLQKKAGVELMKFYHERKTSSCLGCKVGTD